MNIRFSEQALEDTLEIHEKLEQFKRGLGDRFYDELREIYDLLKRNVASFQALNEDATKRRRAFH